MHDILGQESEQRNQPTHPRDRLEIMPDFSFLVPTGNGRTAMEDTFILQTGQKERKLLTLFSNSYLRVCPCSEDAENIKWGKLKEISKSCL